MVGKTPVSRMIEDWILEDNLEAFLELLSGKSGYKWSESDMEAVESLIKESDGEAESYIEYPLGQSGTIVQLAQKSADGIILIKIKLGKDLSEYLAMFITDLCGDYRIKKLK